MGRYRCTPPVSARGGSGRDRPGPASDTTCVTRHRGRVARHAPAKCRRRRLSYLLALPWFVERDRLVAARPR
jgi:hypothetical protein